MFLSRNCVQSVMEYYHRSKYHRKRQMLLSRFFRPSCKELEGVHRDQSVLHDSIIKRSIVSKSVERSIDTFQEFADVDVGVAILGRGQLKCSQKMLIQRSSLRCRSWIDYPFLSNTALLTEFRRAPVSHISLNILWLLPKAAANCISSVTIAHKLRLISTWRCRCCLLLFAYLEFQSWRFRSVRLSNSWEIQSSMENGSKTAGENCD